MLYIEYILQEFTVVWSNSLEESRVFSVQYHKKSFILQKS